MSYDSECGLRNSSFINAKYCKVLLQAKTGKAKCGKPSSKGLRTWHTFVAAKSPIHRAPPTCRAIMSVDWSVDWKNWRTFVAASSPTRPAPQACRAIRSVDIFEFADRFNASTKGEATPGPCWLPQASRSVPQASRSVAHTFLTSENAETGGLNHEFAQIGSGWAARQEDKKN